MSGPQRDRLRLIDLSSSVEVGQGFRLAWNVGPEGDQWPMLVDDRVSEVTPVPCQPAHFRDLAPHELDGQLPTEFQQFWCGAPARTGRPCRKRVAFPGDRCYHHPLPPPTSTPAPTGDPTLFDLEPPSETP